MTFGCAKEALPDRGAAHWAQPCFCHQSGTGQGVTNQTGTHNKARGREFSFLRVLTWIWIGFVPTWRSHLWRRRKQKEGTLNKLNWNKLNSSFWWVFLIETCGTCLKDAAVIRGLLNRAQRQEWEGRKMVWGFLLILPESVKPLRKG